MKHVYKYATATDTLAKEVVAELTDDEIKALFDELSQWGIGGWNHWRKTHSQDTHEYMAATPAQRRRKKCWKAINARLALAAYWDYQLAARFLRLLDDPALQAGAPYRHTASGAAQIYHELRRGSIVAWPWPETGSPFDE